MLRYPILILDHDDTVVKSTPQIHYPAFAQSLKELRPNRKLDLEEFVLYNFEPGFNALCRDILGFSEEEMARQVDNWAAYVKAHVPEPYDGFSPLLQDYCRAGGRFFVVSHSLSENIYRDYEKNGLPRPELVFGWERPEEERKPSPFPLFQIMEQCGCDAKDMLVVDDLKPGREMALSADVPFACAGWFCDIPKIRDYMMENSNFYLHSVSELRDLLWL